MTAWGEIVRTVERLRRTLRRFFAGARRGRRGVPVYVAPGPPPHWVERVRRGAPGLLEPPAREQVTRAQPSADVAPAEAWATPDAPGLVGKRGVATTVTPVQRTLGRLRRSMPRPMRPRPAAPAHHLPPPAVDAAAPDALVRQDPPPPKPGPPPAAAAVWAEAGPRERPAVAAAPVRPQLRAVAPPPPSPEPPRMSMPAVSRGLSPEIPAYGAEGVRGDMSGDRPWTALPRPRLGTERGPAPQAARMQPLGEHAAITRLELAVATRFPVPPLQAPELRLAPVRHPWPELPPPAVHHDVDHDATQRALARERRLDREQDRL